MASDGQFTRERGSLPAPCRVARAKAGEGAYCALATAWITWSYSKYTEKPG